MNIGQNILNLRKGANLSQEQLAEKMGVTRQTISNWELDESSPDLKQGRELSKIFNVSLDELTNNDIKEVLVEKTTNTEKLAGIILNLLKFIVVFIIVVPILLIALKVIVKNIHEKDAGRLMEVSIECTLNNETYSYEFVYYETTGEIKYAGGDGYLANIVEMEKFSDAYQALDRIDFFVKNNGGTCKISESKPYEE